MGGRVGVVIIDSSQKVVAANQEAVEILCGSRQPQAVPNLNLFLSRRLREISKDAPVRKDGNPQFRFQGDVYFCQRMAMTSWAGPDGVNFPGTVMLLCPVSAVAADIESAAQAYNLTPREVETLQGLIEGLSSKEIAARMGISASTVKAFVRMLNVKIGTTSRTAIVAKLLTGDLASVQAA